MDLLHHKYVFIKCIKVVHKRMSFLQKVYLHTYAIDDHCLQ